LTAATWENLMAEAAFIETTFRTPKTFGHPKSGKTRALTMNIALSLIGLRHEQLLRATTQTYEGQTPYSPQTAT